MITEKVLTIDESIIIVIGITQLKLSLVSERRK